MNEASTVSLAVLAGAAIGSFFFGGLWWTTRAGLGSKRPAAWFLCSVMLRMGVAAAGFYWVAHGDWRRAPACLLGFLAARTAAIWRTRAPKAHTP
jgi:F1F0 ATPase subunit 2